MHVWVSETRPRMQGANLTAWELAQRGIPHTLFVDSASGLLMRRGDVDVVFVGADRVARNGDVCNKIGTYDKALAARDNDVPFYVALPSPTIDWRAAVRRRDPDRDARRRRGAERRRARRLRADDPRRRSRPHDTARGQLRVRRDAGAARHRARHRARRRARVRESAARRCFPSGAMTRERAERARSCAKQSIATALAMNAAGINRGKSGNVSARWRATDSTASS